VTTQDVSFLGQAMGSSALVRYCRCGDAGLDFYKTSHFTVRGIKARMIES